MIDFLQVHIGEDQLVITAVNNSWPVRAGKDICGRHGPKCFQHRWLRAEGDLLLLSQLTLEMNSDQDVFM